MSASDYFELSVYQAYRDFDRHSTRTNAVQLAVAAWHVVDRLKRDRGNQGGFVESLFAACPELDLVRRLANVGKHDQLRDPDQMVHLEGAEGGGILESFSPLGMTSSVNRGSLELVEANGSRHDLGTVFRRVMEFWKFELAKRESTPC